MNTREKIALTVGVTGMLLAAISGYQYVRSHWQDGPTDSYAWSIIISAILLIVSSIIIGHENSKQQGDRSSKQDPS